MRQILFFTFCLLIGCSKLKENIPTTIDGIHGKGVLDTLSNNFHGNLVKQKNYNLKTCQKCHGSNYRYISNAKSCFDCHTSTSGPEACNVCHGFTGDTIYKPMYLGNTDSLGDGYHKSHLMDSTISKPVECIECHTIPTNVFESNHIDLSSSAEINFGELASSGSVNPNYFDKTCENTYCHGNFVFLKNNIPLPQFQYIFTSDTMKGNNSTMKWDEPNPETTCGPSCHNLPPIGHLPFQFPTTCFYCHSNVLSVSGDVITNKSKHINGKSDFGQ